jgi:hypothetical protein
MVALIGWQNATETYRTRHGISIFRNMAVDENWEKPNLISESCNHGTGPSLSQK